MCLQVAVSESEKAIESAWTWIREHMIPQVKSIKDPFDKEQWVVDQMKMVVLNIKDSSIDELSSDEDLRNASRTFRQTFTIPPSERLVSYYSCACNGRQGRLYISENYLGFYSFLLGVETMILIELRDIQGLKKENSKRNLIPDSIRLTKKDEEEYFFSNMFRRDEAYDLFIQLIEQSVQRLLKSSRSDIPGASQGTSSALVIEDTKEQMKKRNSNSATLSGTLKDDLTNRKKNKHLRQKFKLPPTEDLDNVLDVRYKDSNNNEIQQPSTLLGFLKNPILPGKLYLSQSFIVFESTERSTTSQHHPPTLCIVLPLYSIKRVERISTGSYISDISITTWHSMEHVFEIQTHKTSCEKFCYTLKDRLQEKRIHIKRVKPFVASFESEHLLHAVSIKDFCSSVSDACGLGTEFGYPDKVEGAKDIKRMMLWKNHFKDNGRNLTLARQPALGKAVRVGLPNILRGEMWEVCSGAIFRRFENPGEYDELLRVYQSQTSMATQEIEKDLHRSLPEYAAYQTDQGIDRLRRVLKAYSWKHPELGYCQAMNIVVAALLIYMGEEKAFWALEVLVESMCPGYYSTSMYGAVLDQIVFEEFVDRTMPALGAHFKTMDIQLSVASLPWFLTLYINSMPLEYASRVLDCLFIDGPRVLFQIGLAILKTNYEAIMATEDDAELLTIIKKYYNNLNALANADTHKNKEETTQLSNFNELMVLAYTEFSIVTNETILDLRRQNQLKIVGGIESFTKRSTIRRLEDTAQFNKEEISILYDKFFGAIYYAKETESTSGNTMDIYTFQKMLASMTEWAVPVLEDSPNAEFIAQTQEHFIKRLYTSFQQKGRHGLVFQDAVRSLGALIHGDFMANVQFFFDMYDNNKDGVLGNYEIADMGREIFWLLMQLGTEKELAWEAIDSLLLLCLEQSVNDEGFSDEDLAEWLSKFKIVESTFSILEVGDIVHLTNAFLSESTPCIELPLAAFRMVALTHVCLEAFFEKGLSSSIKLEKVVSERQKSLGKELFETLFTEGKKLANNVAQVHATKSNPFIPKESPSTPPEPVDMF
ncbi:rab-GTPase-TBC domain-containing protein [Spinellus fusiger]|nr:rab-GTPase-TBC domain-containing protein [Spinellus fusiger]